MNQPHTNPSLSSEAHNEHLARSYRHARDELEAVARALGVVSTANLAAVVGAQLADLRAQLCMCHNNRRARQGRPVDRAEDNPRALWLDDLADLWLLTAAERRTLHVIAAARPMSYRDCAKVLGVSDRTVQFHATNLFSKSGVGTRRDFDAMLERQQSHATV